MLVKSEDEIKNTIQQLSKLQSGEIKPLVTSIPHLDYHLLSGAIPSTIVSIVAKSGGGKTFFLEKILSGIEKSNNTDDIIFLQCNWEISQLKQVVRDLVKNTGKSAKDILFSAPTAKDKEDYSKITAKYKKDNLYLQTKPATPEEFFEDVKILISRYPDKKIVVSLDNLENTRVVSGNQKDKMDQVLSYINILAKSHKYIIFFILNQENRDNSDRQDPNKHFPETSSIYGTGQLEKISDVLVMLDMPFKDNIKKYGLFPKTRYRYIPDSFKIKGSGRNDSFNGDGNLYYFYKKSRDISLSEDIQNVFVEKIFDVLEDTPPQNQEKDDEFKF